MAFSPAPASPSGDRHSWTVILPVKGGPDAKSRLRTAHRTPADGDGHARLAAAITADTLDAVAACRLVARLIVVTADRRARARAERAGAEVVRESAPGSGLNAAITDGVAAAGRRPGPVAVLLPDLPALRPGDLARALTAAAGALGRGARLVAVPDADGVGTVLLAASDAVALDPAFGADSLRAHRRRGALVLELDLPRLRRDVDTAEDLAAALALGCGPRTTAAAQSPHSVQNHPVQNHPVQNHSVQNHSGHPRSAKTRSAQAS